MRSGQKGQLEEPKCLRSWPILGGTLLKQETKVERKETKVKPCWNHTALKELGGNCGSVDTKWARHTEKRRENVVTCSCGTVNAEHGSTLQFSTAANQQLLDS